MKTPLIASSSTSGFFTEKPKLYNQFHEDAAFKRVNKFYLPSEVSKSIEPELVSLADKVLSAQVLSWTADAERNVPYLKTWDSFGKRKDELITSEGWRNLQDLGISEGIVAIPYENRHRSFSRVHQFLKFHLWCGSSANVTCPSAMTDGAARLLSRQLYSNTLSSELRPIYQSAYNRLTSRDPSYAWTSGQWMTERQGGSDVSRTETIATLAIAPLDSNSLDGFPLGPWSISGFKWFSSATDACMTILLARTPDDKISTFFAPMRRTLPEEGGTELNGVGIQRLKVKYGTKSLPTAELELKDMRGYLLGTQGYGIREIATMLNITRMHTAIGTLGGWGRGLAISRAFARVRVVGGKKLVDVPAHVRVMAQQEVEYRGYMHLSFFSVLLLGISEQTATSENAKLGVKRNLIRIMPDQKDAISLLRILTPVVKATTAKAGIAGLSECMESLGGIGYLENEEMEFNIARLLRDAAVSAIWEGTTDVLASDLLKVLTGRQGRETMMVLEKWLSNAGINETGVAERFATWKGKVEIGDLDMLKLYGRDIMFELGRIIGGCLLKLDADSDGCPLAGEIYRRWVDGIPGPTTTAKCKEGVEMDKRIVFEGRIQRISAKL